MNHRRVESSAAIRARFRRKLARNCHSAFNDPPEPLPGVTPLTPSQPAAVPADPPQDVAALDLLRADLRASNRSTLQHVDALGGRLDSMRASAEDHRNAHQQQLDIINNSVNALDLSALQDIPPMTTNVAACHHTALSIADTANKIDDDLSLLMARSKTSWSNGLATIAQIKIKVAALLDGVQELKVQADNVQSISQKHYETLATDIVANTRSTNELNRKISSLETIVAGLTPLIGNVQSSILAKVEAQGTVINSLHGELLLQRETINTMSESNTSLHEVQILEQVSERLDFLKVLAPAVADLVKMKSEFIAGNRSIQADSSPRSGLDLQAELERIGAGISSGERSPSQTEFDCSEARSSSRQRSPSQTEFNSGRSESEVEAQDFDWSSANARLREQQQGALEPYKEALF
ncbi:hypothetical protein KCU95_g2304, partial [Aureobasidium melanogenum]